ncbi:MAG TPA: SusC/RagA family TonB-linked outer membrane protein, partial [Membranihabitans sp.]|nr:SusC/RagA family TonB-linked outer membrane protein [Membranihabitans sp.]
MKLKLLFGTKGNIAMLLYWVLLIIYQVPAQSNVPGVEKILLEEAFQKIGNQFGVFFNYDQEMVSEMRVDYEAGQYDNVDEALSFIFGQTDLKYQIFDKRYVAVYRDTDEGVESIKKMIDHFQGIVDRKESVNARKATAVHRLETYSVQEVYNKRLVLNVSGIVTDPEGEPLIGVNVIVKGSDKGSATDFNGHFTVEDVDDNDILVFSYIGYQTKELSIDGRNSINVVLLENSQTLDEVIVVGYGTQKKVNLTGAVSTLNGEDLAKRQVAQSSLLLQGVAPGVVVTQRNGQPGRDGGTISIRGKTTLGNSNPLILIDGVEGSINSIDPAMIESISVLKDAASSAIYGSRASAGVILVTTKRADSNGKMSISYNTYFGKQTPTDLPDMVGAIDHMLMTNEAYINTGRSQLYSDEFIEDYRNNLGSNPDVYPNTDWYDEVLIGNGNMQSHFLTFSGGTERARISTSFGYLDQGGIMANTNYKRYNLRINSDLELFKGLSAKLDAYITQGKTVEPTRGTSSAIHWSGRIPANQGGRLSDGSWGVGWNGDNPIAFTQDGGLRTIESPSVTLNLGLIYQPTDWLTMNAYYSPQYSQSNQS